MLKMMSSWLPHIDISSEIALKEYIRQYSMMESVTYDELKKERYHWGHSKSAGINIERTIGVLNGLEIQHRGNYPNHIHC